MYRNTDYFVYFSFLLFFVMITASLAVLLWTHLVKRRRARQLRSLAERHGFDFQKSGPDFTREYADTEVVRRNSLAESRNEISGATDGLRLRYFDAFSPAKKACLSIVACHAPYSFRPLRVEERKPLLARNVTDLEEFTGWGTVDLDLAEFNASLKALCTDKKFTFDLLHQRAMEFLLERPGMRLETVRGCFFLYYMGRLPAEGVEKLISDARIFASLLPSYLRISAAV